MSCREVMTAGSYFARIVIAGGFWNPCY
jgi:hypothetical protein